MYPPMSETTSSPYKIIERNSIQKKELTTEQKLYQKTFLPVAVHFTEWVLQQAQKKGLMRLYFLARDGYQFFLLADAICKERNLPMECRYLEGSRYAWRLPEYHLLKEEAIQKICIGGIHVTLEKILQRAGLQSEEILQVAKELNLEEQLRTEMSYAKTQELQSVLKESKKLNAYMRSHSKEAYDITMKYFRQEGLFEDIPYALVDSGWTGSLQQTLTNLLNSYDGKNRAGVEGFYFGLYELPKNVVENLYHGFYFSPKRGLIRKAKFSNCLFEAIFTSPVGMTYGYQRMDNGKIIVIRETDMNPNEKRICENIEVLEQFIKNYCKSKEWIHPSSYRVKKILTKLMFHPQKEEALCLGSYLFSDDVWSTSLQKVAADLTEEEIVNQHVINKMLIMTGRKKGELKNSAWIEGSIAKNGTHMAYYRFQAYLYKILIYIRKLWKRK